MDTILDDDFDWGTDIEDWSTDGFIESIGSSSSTDEDAIFSDIPTSFLIPFCMIFVAITIVMIMAMWKIFKKAGQEGWKSIIPIYNTYVLFEISGLKGWYVFLGFIPFFGALILSVFSIICYIKLSKSFGKEAGFAVGMLFLPIIFFPILGFGSAEYIGPDGVAPSNTNTQSQENINPSQDPNNNQPL